MKQAIISIAIIACMMVAAIPPFNIIEHAEAEDIPTFEPQSTWWDALWGSRIGITIDATQVSSDLSNFPVCINITNTHLKNNAQTDGDDIAFIAVDNSTQYAHEIELYNSTTGHLIAWVNLTSVSSTEDTFFWLYYGNGACSNQENSADTWGNGYMMVQHFNEESENALDSTANGNDGTVTGATQGVTGIVGSGYSFDGDDYVTTSLDKYYYTHCCWIKEGENWTFYANNDTSSFINGTYDGPIKSAIAGSSLSGFSDRYGSSAVWADTDIDIDGLGCSGLKTFLEAKSFCEGIGARLPTLTEVENSETKGTGCGYDFQYVWTSTPCTSGHWVDEGDPGDVGPKQCVADSAEYYVRPVADNPTSTTASSCFSEITNIKIGELLTASVDEVQIINRILKPSEINTIYNSQRNATDGGFYSISSYETIDIDGVPSPPTSVVVTGVNYTIINLSWDKGDLAYNTIIEYKHEDSYTAEWSRGEGTEIYNGTGKSYSHTALEEGARYYYQLWSWNSEYGYNETCTSKNNYTIEIPEWYNVDWKYRKPITITDNLEGYQTKINISYDGTNPSNVSSNSNANFSDLRFTDSYSRPLPYWIEEKIDGDYCIVWIKNEYNDSTLYMYYGNPTVESMSNATDTFIYWNDFSSEPTITHTDSERRWYIGTDLFDFSGPFAIEYDWEMYQCVKGRWGQSAYFGLTDNTASSNPTTAWVFGSSEDTDRSPAPRVFAFRGNYVSVSEDVWYHHTSTYIPGQNISLYRNGELISWSDTDIGTDYNYTHFKWACSDYGGKVGIRYDATNEQLIGHWYRSDSKDYHRTHWDNIYVRKFSANPPTLTFSNQELPLFIINEDPEHTAENVTGHITEWSCYIDGIETQVG